MDKIPFNISAEVQGRRAVIRITGSIGWDTNAELFRSTVDGLVAQGAEDVHIYINSPGGSCIDASEIVNILSVFKGRVTGEGGALVASAATYIAAHCSEFEMPENGMFMIHKPRGGNYGTAAELRSYLKLLEKTERHYLEIYRRRATDTATLEREWESGDWWMTAREAMDNGFITSVKEPVKFDRTATAMITACGCPPEKLPETNNQSNDTNMDITSMAVALGLPETASEAEITAAIASGRKAQADLEKYKAEQARKEKEARAARIEEQIAAAVKDKRITADMAAAWREALEENYERNSKLLAAMTPVVKPEINKPGAATSGKVTYMGKNFEQLQEENPDMLAELLENDPEAYQSLYDDYLKRNKLTDK